MPIRSSESLWWCIWCGAFLGAEGGGSRMDSDINPEITNILGENEEVTHIQLKINWLGRKRYVWVEVEEVEKSWDWPEGMAP